MLDQNNSASTGTPELSPAPKNKVIATLLSLCLLGGAGQLYLGQKKKGWLLITLAALTSCVGLDFIVLIFGALDAYYTAKKLEGGQTVGEMEWFWQKTVIIPPDAEDQAKEGEENDRLINVANGEDRVEDGGRVIITSVGSDQAGSDEGLVAMAAGVEQAGGSNRPIIIPVSPGLAQGDDNPATAATGETLARVGDKPIIIPVTPLPTKDSDSLGTTAANDRQPVGGESIIVSAQDGTS